MGGCKGSTFPGGSRETRRLRCNAPATVPRQKSRQYRILCATLGKHWGAKHVLEDRQLANLIAACCACNHIKGNNDWTDPTSPNYNDPPSSCSCAASGMASAPGGPAAVPAAPVAP